MQALLDRRLPVRARLGLLAAGARRRLAPRDLYAVRYGRSHVYLSRTDYAVDRASFDFAVREAAYATDYSGAAVLDVGAHKGYYAAYVIAHGAQAVITYEPESANLAVLERTAAGYRRDGVTWRILHAAVDAASGRAGLRVMTASWGHALEPPEAFAEHEIAIETVDVVSLEEALAGAAALAAGRRLVVKLNIEGAECSAVLATLPGAWRDVDEVFVETHPWASCDADDLAAHLEPAGLSRAESAHRVVLRMRRRGAARADRRIATT